MPKEFGTRLEDTELCHTGRILDISIATGLVELVGAQSRPCGRGVGLDGVALVEQTLLVDLAEQIPQGLYIAVVVGDIGVLHVHPVPHEASELLPLVGVLHHLTATGGVVFVDADLLADVLLGDTEGFLDTELYRQTMSIPAGLAVDTEALHRLVPTEDILDRACHDVVNTWHPISGGRAFVEDERGCSFTQGKATGEEVFLLPLV